MSEFQFPPPPPPPPRTSFAASSQHSSFGDQMTGRGRGQGRGRGNVDSSKGCSRGRGTGSFYPPHSQQYNGQQAFNNAAPGHGSPTQTTSHPYSGLPAGSYINPTFRRSHQLRDGKSPGTARGSTSSNGRSAAHRGHHQTTPDLDFPGRTIAGHKRKLEAFREPHTYQKGPGPPTAPPVPVFGDSILPLQAAMNTQMERDERNLRPGNSLGLTPQYEVPQYSSSESEDDDANDEEAMFAGLGMDLAFEHNGTVISLNSAADLANWKKERAMNFPTKARIAAKLKEKRQIGEERKRLLYEAHDVLQLARQKKDRIPGHSLKKKSHAPTTGVADSAEPKAQLQNMTLPVASSKLYHSKTKAASDEFNESTRSRQERAPINEEDAGPAAVPDDGLDGKSDYQTTSSSMSDSSSGSDSDMSSKESSADDSPPEEIPFKLPKADPNGKRVLCRYFVAGGYCRDGNACPYKHELPNRRIMTPWKDSTADQNRLRSNFSKDLQPSAVAGMSRKSIHDRLMEQEQSEEDLLALQVIKYLGKVSFFATKTNNIAL